MKRANLIVYDEASFVDNELIIATTPFVSQDADAKYGKDAAKEKDTQARQPYNQIIMASSQNTIDCTFYKEFKSVAKSMIAGDKTVFCADMPCTTSLKMYMKGEEVAPLLKQSVVDAALKADPEKARREYYNKPDLTGGTNQIIKWNVMRNNEMQIIPYSNCRGNKIVLAFDPARTGDNSIMGAMELVNDPSLGICGNIIGCNNFIDIASAKKYKLDSNRQLAEIRNIILGYNGDNPDYEYIDSILLDAGSGGGGVSTYADGLLNNYIDSSGRKHKGFIDANHEIYAGYRSLYPDAVDKLRLINPKKFRTQMIEEFIELMELGVIRFPYQYNGQEFLKLFKGVDSDGEEIVETYNLSQDEMVHLSQIDLMKTEICSIHKTTNAENTSVSYSLPREKQNIMHDDRFYCAILLAHRLYELRRGTKIKDNRRKKDSSKFIQFRAPKIL